MPNNYPVISSSPAVQGAYVKMRRSGESHRLAEMLALRSGPQLSTDTSFLAGVGTLRDQFDGNDAELNRVVKEAKKQGYTPKATDYYEPSLANRCGDPGAFIPHNEPKGHVRRLCNKRDLACHGAVEVKRKAK